MENVGLIFGWPKRRLRDTRVTVGVSLLVAVGLISSGVALLPSRGVDAKKLAAEKGIRDHGFSSLRDSASQAPDRAEDEGVSRGDDDLSNRDPVRKILKEAKSLIKSGETDKALMILNDARPMLMANAEAFFLMGNALEKKKDYETARDFYNAALNRDPTFADAYWGFATTSEALGDLESALGGMRSYLHSEPDADPLRLRINQARSAIWEWEAKLGRGEWGPTRGIPPGFVADDLKRDENGVGVKWPLIETKQPDGTMKSEVRTAKKIKIYPRP